MNNWEKVKLSTLCFRIGDGLHGTPNYIESGDIYFINGNNVKGGKIIVDNETKRVTKEVLDKNFVELNSNSLLLSINGTLGNMAFFNGENIMLGKSAAYLNFKTDINRFYFYYFQLPSIQKYFYDVATGSTIKNLSLKSLQDFEVPKPTENDHKKIAKVLSDLDAKIELNNKINAQLEAMAKTLYDYWFVQFDFPDANGKPYKSSGGIMIWNEELKREIPEGWESKKTEDLVEDIRTGLNPRDHFKLGGGSNYYITIKNIEYGRIQFDESCDKISDEAKDRIQKRSNLDKGDILFTSIEPVGKTYLLSEKPSNWNINESVFSFKPNLEMVTSEYLFMLLSSNSFNGLCKNASTGSIHKGIRITPMKAFKVVNPKINIIKKFTKIVSPYLNLIDNNQKENQELASLRDWLLPMLMNGQVSVASTSSATKDGYEVEERELGMVADSGVEYKRG